MADDAPSTPPPKDPRVLIAELLAVTGTEDQIEDRQVRLIMNWVFDLSRKKDDTLSTFLAGVDDNEELREADGPTCVGEFLRLLDPTSITLAAALAPICITSQWTVHIPGRAEYRERLVAHIRATRPEDMEGLLQGI